MGYGMVGKHTAPVVKGWGGVGLDDDGMSNLGKMC